MGLLRLLLAPFRGAALLWVVLFIFFFILGGVAMIFGFSLGEVDAWLESQSSWIDGVGDLLFRLVCLFFFLICAGAVFLGIWDRIAPKLGLKRFGEGKPVGWGTMILCLIIAYFLYFGIFYET